MTGNDMEGSMGEDISSMVEMCGEGNSKELWCVQLLVTELEG